MKTCVGFPICVGFYGSQKKVCSADFRVAPGADPSRIGLHFEGVTRISIAPEGDLLLDTPAGPIREHAPVIFQERDGRREPVAGSYLLTGNDQISFRLGPYDHTRELVIDPVILYSTYISGSGSDIANDMKIDSNGNLYLTGSTTSPDFPSGPTANFQGNKDIFVTKLAPDGQSIVYSTFLGQGESGGDSGSAIFVDNSGNAYIGGVISKLLLLGDAHYAVVGKLNADGSLAFLNRVTSTTGDANEQVTGIVLNGAGNICLSGWADLDTIPIVNGFQNTPNTFGSGFMLMLDPGAQNILYSTYIGSAGFSRANDLAVDHDGYVYVTGQTGEIPVTPGAFQQTVAGDVDAYVMKIDPRGNGLGAIVYSTYLGGGDGDTGNAIQVDAHGRAWVAGATKSNNSSMIPVEFPVTPNAAQLHLGFTYAATSHCYGGTEVAFCPDAFVTGFSADGGSLVYSSYLGGDGPDMAQALAVDSVSGQIYVTGQACSFFPVTTDATQGQPTTAAGAFLAVFDPAQPASLVFSTFLSGSGQDQGAAVGRDPSGNVWVAGYTTSTNFPLVNPMMSVGGGNGPSVFVTRYALKPSAPATPLAIRFAAGQLTLTWSSGNTLQEADTAQGQFQDVPGASLPYTVAATAPCKFYRIR